MARNSNPSSLKNQSYAVSLETLLPFEDLTWEKFQDFCTAFIDSLPEVGRCTQYGVAGDSQDGIDIVAELHNGQTWAFQCKRERQFGRKKVEKAIKAATYSADKYIILLSRVATKDTRDAVPTQNTWAMWDAQDISRMVRDTNKISRDTAYFLVSDYFGTEWVKLFLGMNDCVKPVL